MNSIWKTTLKCISVLIAVAFVSVSVVLALNYILPAKTSFFSERDLQSICPADNYYQLTDADLTALGVDLAAFNAPYATANVRAVFRAEGGENDGKYIIEAEGLGYNDLFPIILYIAYDDTGAIFGVVVLNVDPGNNFWSNVRPYLSDIYTNLIGQSGDVGGGEDLLNVKTGATQSLNGVSRAVNIANTFIQGILGVEDNAPYEVTDASLLSKLRALTNNDDTFTGYKYSLMGTVGSISCQVSAVYVSNNGEIIIESRSEAGGYGRTTLLVLVDADTKTVKGINPLSMSAHDYDDYTTEFLNNREKLTEMFEGKSIEDIEGMDKYLQGATGATQTANGIKTAIIIALQNIDSFIEYKNEIELTDDEEDEITEDDEDNADLDENEGGDQND